MDISKKESQINYKIKIKKSNKLKSTTILNKVTNSNIDDQEKN